MTLHNIPIEGPYAPQVDDLYALLNHALNQQAQDNLTRRQEVLTQSIACMKPSNCTRRSRSNRKNYCATAPHTSASLRRATKT